MTLDGESNIYASSNASDKCLNKMYETGTTADEMANCQLLLTGGVCKGVDGYEDIIKGAQVVVSDRSGNNVGLGSLGAGVAGPGGESCRFKFEVTNVPSGGNIYSVEISHRGATKFTQSEAASLAFTLGD